MNNCSLSSYKKKSKVIVPVFAANSSVGYSRFKNSSNPLTARDYVGNIEDLACVIHFLRDIGVTNIMELPFTQKHQSTTSPFSSSLFGLELDYLVLEMVPEVQKDPDLLAIIPKRPIVYEKDMCCAFDIHREARKLILGKASKKFLKEIKLNPDSERARAFKNYVDKYNEQLSRNAVFSIVQSMVLNTYTNAEPDFRTWPIEYQNPENEEVKRLIPLYNEEIEIYQYSQFCLHEQQLMIKDLYHELGLKREVIIAFGIDPSASGDVWWLQGKAFDVNYDIGADNGQNWHIPPYFAVDETYYKLMNERIEYLAQYIDILFLDHMCGYATQYVLDHEDENDRGKYVIDPKNREILINNVERVIQIVLNHGLEVGGETLGDTPRQSAVEEAILRMCKSGKSILEMYVAPHKNISGQYEDLRTLPKETELYLSTHDLPTIIQMLCGKRGNVALNDFLYPEHKIANFLSQQFGILTTPNQTPLNPKDITTEMSIAMLEVFMTSSAEMVTIPIQDIFALLFPQEVGVNEYFNLNIAGTPSWVGNENKNFSRILPPVEKLEPFKEQLIKIFKRDDQPFDYPQRLIEHGNFFTWIANITSGRKLIYQNPLNKRWEIFKHQEIGAPVMEFVIANLCEDKQIGTVELPKEFKALINSQKKYKLVDIAASDNNGKLYYRTGLEMKGHIYIELPQKTDHHFIVYEV
ncbi:MAG: 4-alpha-glucanotransferase [Deltaproteobacteria bacterium]